MPPERSRWQAEQERRGSGRRREERGERTEAAGAAAKDSNSGATVWIVATAQFRQKQGVF